MTRSCLSVSWLLLSVVLFSGLPRGASALDSAEAVSGENSENALNRLIVISGQLSALNEKLRTELQDSRRNSGELQTMLAVSKKELENLRSELEVLKQEREHLRSISTELLIEAENSRLELTALETALRKAESSLTSLELSFAAYRETSEARIKLLEKTGRRWKWGCVAAGVLAAGLGGALLVTR